MSEADTAPLDPEIEAIANSAPVPQTEASEPNKAGTDPTEQAELTAIVVTELAESVVIARWPNITYTEHQRDTCRKRLVPVLLKYQGGLPPWLLRWKEEMELAGFLALTAFQTWQSIEAAHADNDKSDNGKESERDTT